MRIRRYTAGLLLFAVALFPASKKNAKNAEDAIAAGTPVLWREPADIASRNLVYGSGGAEHQPHGPYTFLDEDMNGTNPKFHVKDANGVKWSVKMGVEARPETATSRLVWAVGYFTPNDYFLPEIHVEGMPHLKRGQNLVGPEGKIANVRLKLDEKKDAKKMGSWSWRENPFVGTRPLNGLKVLMAVVNNWDLKDANNEIVRQGDQLVYLVSDLGASFGKAGPALPYRQAKDNLDAYLASKFIRSESAENVSFEVPARPSPTLVFNPKDYLIGERLEWVCKDIPRADARWMGDELGHLTPDQIRDAFRTAGYKPDEVDAFTSALRERISTLQGL